MEVRYSPTDKSGQSTQAIFGLSQSAIESRSFESLKIKNLRLTQPVKVYIQINATR